MAMSRKYTHADLLAIPEDLVRREIIDGELFVHPTPFVSHQRVVGNFVLPLSEYLEKCPVGEFLLGPMDVILNDFNVLNPDLLFVRSERKEILKDWGARRTGPGDRNPLPHDSRPRPRPETESLRALWCAGVLDRRSRLAGC